MATYKQSGVDISIGDKSSAIAYKAAKETFGARKGMIGKPVILEGGFTGALDFGDFYLVQNCDGVGSKVAVADAIGKYDTLGYDLLAMVCDDAVCVGAETISITNTIDTEKVNPEVVEQMMKGLKKACIEQKVVIPGGEIAELPGLIVGNSWNSTAVGIVEKKKFITGSAVKPGDKIIGLKSRGFRSNGFSLVRYVLREKFGEKWFNRIFSGKKTWGEVVLTPSLIYSDALLSLLGRYGKKRVCDIKALVHVTGGGIPGNIKRVLGDYGATLNNLPRPHDMMLQLQEFGKIKDKEAYKTWNMGIGMIMISNEIDKIKKTMLKHNIETVEIGAVAEKSGVTLTSNGYTDAGKKLFF
jgi:phosphoribosylformylglycinamidine cyclo-ligase